MGSIGRWWRTEEQPVTLAVAAIVLVAVLARLSALNAPMRYGESMSYLQFISKSWLDAASTYQFQNNHLLYTLAAKATGVWGGDAPWALRLPAFLAGVAVVPLTYTLGVVRYDRMAALFGAALAAAATPLVLFSANARGYAFLIAAYLGLLIVGERVLQEGSTLRRWALFALLGAVGLATTPLMRYPLGAAAAWVVLSLCVAPHPHRWRILGGLSVAIVGAVALAVLAYIPIIRANGIHALLAGDPVTATTWSVFFARLLSVLRHSAATWAAPYPLILAILLGAVAVVGVARNARFRNGGVSLLLAAYVWSALLLCLEHHAPTPAALVWLVPLLALASGAVLAALMRHPRLARLTTWQPGIAVMLAAAGAAWGYHTDALGRSTDTGVFAGAGPIAQILATQAQPGDHIQVRTPSTAPLRYYLLQAGADTALLSTPDSLTQRQILVLNATYGQTIPWAIAAGMIDTTRFGPIAPATHAADGNVYVAERKAGAGR